jgi:phosphotransferase system enzyme I (PtsI)
MPARRVLTGYGVGSERVAGHVARFAPHVPLPAEDRPAGPPEAELARASTALAEVAAELRRRAARGDTAEVAEILEAEAMMAEDKELAAALAAATAAGHDAPHAIHAAIDGYRQLFAAAGGLLAARVADLDDIEARAVAVAVGADMPGVPARTEPFVLVAEDLAPADTALLDLTMVLALVTEQGGPTSHTAILARARGIPALVGVAGVRDLADDARVIVDPAADQLLVDPDDAEFAAVAPPRGTVAGTTSASTTPNRATANAPASTSDGHEVELLANVSGAAELPAAVAAGAAGVGLFRTEFLYLDAASAPDLETQRAAYRAVLDGFPHGHVVVRTLDAGADKPLPFLPLPAEPNPALGVRGLRAFRDERGRQLLDTQLAALAAAADGAAAELWVMAPMVADAAEAAWFVDLARAHGLARAGVMVEIPSAALTADAVLAVADFASLGTNDLTQYTMAADRMLGPLATLQDPWHPAVLRLVAMTCDAGRRAGRPVGVCGEAAADPRLAQVLVGLGVSSLSMSPAAIGAVRQALAAVSQADCVALAERVLAAPTAVAARASARD